MSGARLTNRVRRTRRATTSRSHSLTSSNNLNWSSFRAYSIKPFIPSSKSFRARRRRDNGFARFDRYRQNADKRRDFTRGPLCAKKRLFLDGLANKQNRPVCCPPRSGPWRTGKTRERTRALPGRKQQHALSLARVSNYYQPEHCTAWISYIFTVYSVKNVY
jgi:hypothetical protein